MSIDGQDMSQECGEGERYNCTDNDTFRHVHFTDGLLEGFFRDSLEKERKKYLQYVSALRSAKIHVIKIC